MTEDHLKSALKGEGSQMKQTNFNWYAENFQKVSKFQNSSIERFIIKG